MKIENHRASAYPGYVGCEVVDGRTRACYAPGLTKRELFAAMAMQGILSDPQKDAPRNDINLATCSVGYADALLAELAKEPEVKHG